MFHARIRMVPTRDELRKQHLEGARPEPPDDSIFLAVSVKTSLKNLRAFERLAHRLLPRFDRAGLTMTLSGWRQAGTDIQMFNLWAMKEANAIISAELELVDDPEYLAIDELLFDEVKDVVFRVSDRTKIEPITTDDRARDPYCYVKVVNEVETSNLAEFRARHDAGAARFGEALGWQFGDAYLGVTGRDTITQIWRVPERARSSVPDYLTRTPWHDLLVSSPQVEILQPSSFDRMMPIDRV